MEQFLYEPYIWPLFHKLVYESHSQLSTPMCDYRKYRSVTHFLLVSFAIQQSLEKTWIQAFFLFWLLTSDSFNSFIKQGGRRILSFAELLLLKCLFLRYSFEIERTRSNVNLMRSTHLVRLDAVCFYASVILAVAIGFAERRKWSLCWHQRLQWLLRPDFSYHVHFDILDKTIITYRATHYRLSPLLAVYSDVLLRTYLGSETTWASLRAGAHLS